MTDKILNVIRFFFCFSLFLLSNFCQSQDTVSVYFTSGNYKIEHKQSETLNSIPNIFDFTEIDSIYFIGVADSTGSIEHNLELSEKRAKSVAKYCEKIIPASIPITIKALGEKPGDALSSNRRVDIIFLYKPKSTESVEVLDSTTRNCFYVDYKLLHRSNLRSITKGKKKYILLETNLDISKDIKTYFTATENKSGEIATKKVKWNTKNTGRSFWVKTKYSTSIPETDFTRFKIFKIEKPPCDTCSEDYATEKKITKEAPCEQVDRFLMGNIQVKNIPFNFKTVNIRALKEYVNPDYKYYVGCNKDARLKWFERQGKKKSKYYFARLPRTFDYLYNITRVMDCCEAEPEPSECDKPMIRFIILEPPNKSLFLRIKFNTSLRQHSYKPSAEIELSKQWAFICTSLSAGANSKFNFCGSAQLQTYLISFPFNAISPISIWQTPKNWGTIYKYGRLFIGTEMNYGPVNDNTNFFEQNFHLGIAAVDEDEDGAFLQRIYLQFGIANDYSKKLSTKAYTVAELGINLKITALIRDKE